MADAGSRYPALLRLWGPFALLFALGIALAQDHCFFWDTVSQASRRGSWYYFLDFHTFFLPPELDSGHPVFFNMYVAAVWKALGRSLPASHWAMLPFAWGILWQLARLVVAWFPAGAGRYWAMGLAVSTAAFLGQAILVSPDLVLLFAFLWGLNSIRRREAWSLALALVLMNMVSLRGLFAAAGLGFFHLFLFGQAHRSWAKGLADALRGKNLWPFLLALLFAAIYYGAHYRATGWWISTPHPNWAGGREVNSPLQLLRQTGILGWRFLDYGFFGYWLLLGRLLWQSRPSSWSPPMRFLLGAAACTLLAYLPGLLGVSNPISHRYLLPVMMPMVLGLAYWLLVVGSASRRWVVLLLVLNLTGNLWVYPRHIAQAWDATLAHWPYYATRDRFLAQLERAGIEPQQVGTRFPHVGPLDRIDLSGREAAMPPADLSRDSLVAYSTVMNDFSDAELAELDRWNKRIESCSWPVCWILYEKNR